MKTITKYILMAAVVLMATSCEKDSILSQYEGGVNFDIKMSAGSRTTSTDGSDNFTPEQMRVRIYRGDGKLIRRYTKSSDIPSPLYLVEGSYSVVVDAGNLDNVAFKEPATADERKQKLCYAGSNTFDVKGKEVTEKVEVNCPTINSKVTIGFDKKDSESDNLNSRFENRYLTDVQIKVAAISADGVTNFETLSAKADEADAPNLLFTYEDDDTEGGTQSGYFLMPEGVKSLIWAFKATHATDGEINTSGVVSTDVKAGNDYRVNFKYARTPNGAGGITVRIDESVETFDDKYSFKPQPEITGEGFDVTVASAYKDQAVVFYCESIYDLYNLSLNGSNFFDGGNVNNEHNITGLTCVEESDTKVKITLAPEYFVNFPSGAINLSFDMQDKDGDKVSETYPQKVVLMKQGFMELSNPNLWANTADISAVVTKENVNSVGFKIRKKGTNDWSEEFSASNVPAEAGDGFRIFKASTVASWTEGTNPNGHTIYTPNVAKSIFAGNTYEIQTVIDGVEYGSIREYAAPASAQTIQDGNMNNTELSCYHDKSDGSALFWGSGNNWAKTNLCKYHELSTGNYCAILTSSETMGFLAAGNLFTGQFLMEGMGGTVSFGVKYDWSERPSSLKLKWAYDLKQVSMCKYEHTGQLAVTSSDYGSVYVCIIDWNSQHKVKSGDDYPTGVWSPEDGMTAVSEDKIIGYGVVYPTGNKGVSDNAIQLEELEIPIHYYDKTAKPTNGNFSLIIAAATSRYGDYMNGAAWSTMYLDDFQWGY